MNLDHHLARMSPPHPALALLAARSELLAVVMGDKRDAANIYRRMARDKDLEADHCRARINRLSLVRARILRRAS